MLLNLVRYAGDNTGSPLASLPDDFAEQLKAIGYDK